MPIKNGIRHLAGLFPLIFCALLFGCEATPKQVLQRPPPGLVGKFVYHVSPLINGGYDITVVGAAGETDEALRVAWMAKARELGNGRQYTISPLAFKSLEDTNYIYTGVFMTFPVTSKSHSLFGTLTIN